MQPYILTAKPLPAKLQARCHTRRRRSAHSNFHTKALKKLNTISPDQTKNRKTVSENERQSNVSSTAAAYRSVSAHEKYIGPHSAPSQLTSTPRPGARRTKNA
ncbi:hypothetical protein Vretifemale_6575 [Volvox reticuliferus]|uniref:Uncharacterized protein n=1 Tax=Volvox reticuliferus TaxID=1737510 RepID=A0A8J4C7F4_9CHLO|nr:hypothetical protein Vretifemale_6575 [Volvox reticuliferus]